MSGPVRRMASVYFQPCCPIPRPNPHAGHPIRVTHPRKAAPVHPRRHPDAHAGDRGEHCDLQPPVSDPPAAAAVSERGPSGLRLEQLPEHQPAAGVGLHSRLSRSAHAGPRRRGRDALHVPVGELERRREPRTGARARGNPLVLLHASASAVHRPWLPRRRGEARRRQVRRPHLRTLDVALWIGSVDRRPRHPRQRRQLPRRRRAAGRLRAAGARDRRAHAVRVHAAADVRQCAGQRVQRDDRAAASGRDDRTVQRADQDDHGS